MKKLFSLLIVFISIKCFGQVYQVLPQYGYEMKRVNATLVLLLPSDTVTNKTGVARIGTVLYSGNGTKWTPATATDTTSLSNRINLKVNISDTAAMLSPYAKTIVVNTKVNISDTAAMLSPYAKTSVVNSGLALKVNIADTAAMLTNYAKTSAVNLKVNISDTASMLTNYAKTSAVNSGLALKVNISDTASMLTNYAKTSVVNSGLALKVNISDTAAMLANYAKTSAVNSAVALKVNIADTATMLTPYLRKIDTASLSNRINLKADINSPTFTGTVGGITQSMVGLGNVTNESKATMFNNATFTGTFATAAGAIGNASLANGAVANLSGTNTGDQNLQSVTNLGATTTNSITANSLIKSGGTASQILAADGSVITAGNFITITGGQISSTSGASGGGSSVNYYLNGGTSQGTFGGSTYYEFSKTAVIGTGADFSRGTNGYIASFITDIADPSLLLIPAGNWNLEFYFNSSSAGGSPSFYVELYKYDGTTFTSIASSSATPEGITNGTSIDAYFTALAVPETILTVNDRLAIRVFVNASSKTITLHTQNGHLCEVITTFTSGLTALNGLQAQVQNFGTGTSGTDFAISSSGSTHTFNLPDASAANRGALSSADWSTFNNKGSVSSIATDNTTGITGGTITTTGTLAIDTTVISTRKWRQKGIDSVQANLTTGLALKVNISDTSSMLSSYFRKVDTASLSNRINLKLNISDTSSMLSPYARTNSVNAGLALKVNISDTATMLSPYARKNFLNAGTGISYSSVTGTIGNTAPDQTVALTAGTGISTSGTYPNFTITNTSPSSGGTVTSVAALTLGTSGTDLSSTVANSTTTPVITLNVPTASATNRGALSSADWTTFNNKAPALSGTTNYVPKFTGASTIGNSAFYDEGGFGGFNSTGLGSRTFVIQAATSRPLAIELVENANVHAVYVRPNNSGYNLISSNYISGGVYIPLALSGRESSSDLVLWTNGNTSIGTTTDAGYKLDVNGTGRFSSSVTSNGNMLIQKSQPQIQLYQTGADHNYSILGNTNVALEFWHGTFGSNTTKLLSLESGGAATFSSSVTAVSALLQSANTNLVVDIFTLSNPSQTSSGVRQKFANGYGDLAAIKVSQIDNGAGANDGKIEFQTATDAVLSTKLTILETGATTFSSSVTATRLNAINDAGGITLDIGSTNTANTYINYKYNNASIAYIGNGPSIFSGAASTDLGITTSGAYNLLFGTNNTERMRITSGGNVLVGTTTDAGYKLDVNGTGRFSGKVFLNTTTAYTSELNVQAIANNRPAIKAGYGGVSGNGYWILGDNYTTDESLMAIGIDYSSGGLVLGSALAPSTTTNGAFISTQAQFGGYGSAIRLGTSGEIVFYNGTQNSVIAAGSAKTASVALTIAQTGAATFSSSVTATQGNFNQTATSGFAINMTNRNANQTWSLIVDTDAVDDKILGFQSSYGFTPFYALKLDAVGGAATFSSSIKTAAPSGGTAKPFKIGAAATVTPTLQNRTIEIEIDGVTYYLTAKTTND